MAPENGLDVVHRTSRTNRGFHLCMGHLLSVDTKLINLAPNPPVVCMALFRCAKDGRFLLFFDLRL